MSKSSKKTKSQTQEEIGKALRSSGALLPETEDEVKAFYEIYGNTKIDLPEKLQSADFLFEEKKVETKIIPIHPFDEETEAIPQLAYAARDGQEDLPEAITEKMKNLKKEKRSKKKKF